MSPPPVQTIRRYLDDHGGETDATLGHLLTSFGIEDQDHGGRDEIATTLSQAGIYVDRPISFLRTDDPLHLSTTPPPPRSEESDHGPSVDDELQRISVQERRAGWYQDPTSRDLLRWWDGSAWTEVARPAQPASFQPPVAAYGPMMGGPPAPPGPAVETPWYKRWWFSGLVVLLLGGIAAGIAVLVLSSDDGSKAPSAKPARSAHSSPLPDPRASVVPVGDSLTLKGSDTTLRARVTGVVDPLPAGEFDSPSSGNRYVGVQVALRNVGSGRYSDAISNGSTLILRGNQQADSTIVSGGACSSNFGSDLKLAPGDTRSGCIPFEVPQNARLRKFQLTLDSGFAGDTGEWAVSSAPTTSGPAAPSSPATPAPAPASYTACDGNVMARAGTTTCPFAENAFWEYWTSGQPGSISVWSPTTSTYYTLSCDTTNDVVCTSDGDAGVKFSQASVDGYTQEQADNYAATHEVGPGE